MISKRGPYGFPTNATKVNDPAKGWPSSLDINDDR
jgi:hypothetical protein